MIKLTTKIKQMNIESGKRILVTSDIHGNLKYLKNVLTKASFSDNDILFIVGDIIEKGAENLKTLRYVMELCKKGNIIPLIGNV
ncbi:MAG: metallophosphoesterase, partial [Acutalibacteraceae bacterium]|nr:metallophosphoesterase [Acutalibacteraceae bacterium]